MEWFFAGVTIALLFLVIRDEFREGGSLHMQLSELVGPHHPDFAHLDPDVGSLIVFPAADAWTEHDVAVTLAEIEAL